MEQSTTILNETKPSSILLYSVPWMLLLHNDFIEAILLAIMLSPDIPTFRKI